MAFFFGLIGWYFIEIVAGVVLTNTRNNTVLLRLAWTQNNWYLTLCATAVD